MPYPSKPTSMAGMSLVYITVGALIDVWSGIRLWYLREHLGSDVEYYWCWGFLLTGATLFLIGLAVGQIGRAARHAEVPSAEVTPATEAAAIDAAPRAPIVAPINPTPVTGAALVSPATVPPNAPVARRV